MQKRKTTKSGTLSYIIIDRETGEYSHSTSAENAGEVHEKLTASKVRDHITYRKKNCLKGRFIILDLRNGSNAIHIEESLIDLLK